MCGYTHVSAGSHTVKRCWLLLELELQGTVSYSNPPQEKYIPLTTEPTPSPMNYMTLLIATETTDETFTYDTHTHQTKNLLDSYVKANFKVYIVKPSYVAYCTDGPRQSRKTRN